MAKFRYVDHTSDLGIEVFGKDLPELFQHAAEGFFHIITDPGRVRRERKRQISLRAGGLEELLVKWLEEFIFLFDTEHLLFNSFRILSIDEGSLQAVASGEPYDDTRHAIKTVVKGATYHQLEIRQTGDTWKARVIFDL